jgi:hypothetical protein
MKYYNSLKIVCLVLFTGLYIYASLAWQPVRVIHPDAVHFMNIIQEQYEKINTINDFPIAIYTAFRNCDNYDWNRGRLTNYFAFGIEALVRGWLPLPFISWITMLILLLNAVLLGKLIIKEIKPQTTRVSIFCLVVLFVVLNPSFVYSYETQFIYPKYLCITFILLFMLTGNMLLKGLLIRR